MQRGHKCSPRWGPRPPSMAPTAIFPPLWAPSLGVPPRSLNGSVGYLPALVALIGVARAAHGPARRGLELAAMIFTVSLALRTIDLKACDTLPLGTHFSWHLLNAAVLYVLLRTAIKEAGV